MRAQISWSREDGKSTEKGKGPSPVYSVCFNPEGTQLVAAVGNRVLVYDANDGDLLHQLKGHKNTVYAVAYSHCGKRFASGSADMSVIIWTNTCDGILRYSHNTSVQCLAYNPVTAQLASMTCEDFGLWSPEQKSVNKYKVSAKILSASWTNDGQYLALGLISGTISIRDKTGAEKVKISRDAPIWTLMWNPSKNDAYDTLVVGCWDQTLSFYQLSGTQVGKDKALGFDPCSVQYFSNGEYIVVGGSDRKASLWTRDGVRLESFGTHESWVWSATPRPKQNFVAVGSNDGTVVMHNLLFSTVHGLYQDRYAYREFMTDVIIQHLMTEQKARIKCKEYVKKIAVYKNRLAVQLPERIVVYQLKNADPYDMLYGAVHKINKILDCNLLVVTSCHVTLCLERKLQLYNHTGEKEHEWVLESVIRYIKVVGGPIGKEGLIVGLKSGLVLKIFLNNPFPIPLVRHQASVRCLDLSMDRLKLAVVDELSNCVVYDLSGHGLGGQALERVPLWSEPNANSVAWNIDMPDMLCFSGNSTLAIKTANFPIHQQKLQGFVVGFKGSKIFCLHYQYMQTIDVPQSQSMQRYVEIKDFDKAYKVACLGVTEADWRLLATSALGEMKLGIARKGFIRVRDMRCIELLNRLELNHNPHITLTASAQSLLQGEILAFQGQYQQAARVLAQAGHVQKAIDIFSDLRKWEEAAEFARNADGIDVRDLMRRQAQWSVEMNDLPGAAKMWLAAGCYPEAIKLFQELRDTISLQKVANELTANDTEALQRCADAFAALDAHDMARQILLKLGDMKALLEVYVRMQNWSEALALLPEHPEHNRDVYLPYAKWLLMEDRFEDAQEAFKQAGEPGYSLRMLEVMAHNAVVECRFKDASCYFWQVATETLKGMAPGTDRSLEGENVLARYQKLRERAMLYFAYDKIYHYIEDPFTADRGDVIFGAARFILSTIGNDNMYNISRVYTLITLAKQATALGAFKLARFAYDQLHLLKVPRKWQDELELATLKARAKPHVDDDDLLPTCFNCSTEKLPLINTDGDKCSVCGHPFIRDLTTFDILPLVEFELKGMSQHEFHQKLGSHHVSGASIAQSSDGWSSHQQGGADVMRMDDQMGGKSDKFDDLLMSVPPGDTYAPIVVPEEVLVTMKREEVFALPVLGIPNKWRYFKSMLPKTPVSFDANTQLFFHEEDLEFYMLRDKCPLSRATQTSTKLRANKSESSPSK
eukprot:TRINITY_DN4577_c0_g1_i1.p1 TRINITY_DN4577_c0_g1~~TRINITY_DN4577_c0_g1_i1.p1  ORF type:complete len:1218 (-),score=334.96 TRINITY_DN4577_c0_g1_i1:117-3770(-)